MQKTYYIFYDNLILCRNSKESVKPLNFQEWGKIRHKLGPHLTLESPTKRGTFIIELDHETTLPPQYHWVSLRSQVGQISDILFKSWGRASQLIHWHKTHSYCGSCGTKTRLHPEELAKSCPQCGACYYPTISPCIIVLVCREEKLLLARSPRFPEKMFSTLAGFIEPGESAEETVIREIGEEVNIEVKNIRYFGSQPWPFPGQLMLGYFADYASGEIEIDGEEICEAHWYPHDSLPQIPGEGTIAGQLIRHYVKSFVP